MFSINKYRKYKLQEQNQNKKISNLTTKKNIRHKLIKTKKIKKELYKF